MNELEMIIEQTRKELLMTAREQGLSSTQTIRLSIELDHLLNLYDTKKQDHDEDTHIQQEIG